MNSLSNLLIYFDVEYTRLKHEQKVDITSMLLLYLFKLVKSSELMDTINEHLDWTGTQGIEFRKRLQGKGEIQLLLKFYVYDRVINKKAKPDPKKFGVRDEDALFVRNMLRLRHKNILYLKKGLEKYNRDGFPPRTLTSFQAGMETALVELQTTCDKFISKKLRFLTQSGQMERGNLRSEMLEFAIYSIYRAYPEVSSRLHMKNIGMRAISNRGKNIIKEQTTQSRKRLIQNEDGTFSGTLLSFSHAGFEASQNLDLTTGGALSVCNHLMVGLEGQSVAYERPQDVDRRRDLQRTVEQVSDKLNGTKPKTFIRLMMGEHSAKFSKWLGQPNDEAIDEMDPREYSEKVRQYLDIPVSIARKYVTNLRQHLKDFRN